MFRWLRVYTAQYDVIGGSCRPSTRILSFGTLQVPTRYITNAYGEELCILTSFSIELSVKGEELRASMGTVPTLLELVTNIKILTAVKPPTGGDYRDTAAFSRRNKTSLLTRVEPNLSPHLRRCLNISGSYTTVSNVQVKGRRPLRASGIFS